MALAVNGVGPRVLATLVATVVLTVSVSAAGGAFSGGATTTTPKPEDRLQELVRCFGPESGEPVARARLQTDGSRRRLNIKRWVEVPSGCTNPQHMCVTALPVPPVDNVKGYLRVKPTGAPKRVEVFVGLVSISLTADQIAPCSPAAPTKTSVEPTKTTTASTSTTGPN